MPVVLAAPSLAALTLLIVLIAFVYSFQLLVAYPLQEALRPIPVLGERAAAAVGGAMDSVLDTLKNWLTSLAHTLIDWLRAAAEIGAGFLDETRAFALDVADAFDTAIHITVHKIIKAFLAPVHKAIAAAATAIATLERTFDAFRDRINTVVIPRINSDLGVLGRGIDRLRDDVIPTLRREVTRGIDRITTRINDNIIPRIRGIEISLPNLRTRVNGIDDLLRDVRSWSVPIASVFTGAAVVALLRHVRTCQPKTERLCNLDPQYLEGLLGLALILPHLDEIRNVVKQSARAANGLVDEFSESLRD